VFGNNASKYWRAYRSATPLEQPSQGDRGSEDDNDISQNEASEEQSDQDSEREDEVEDETQHADDENVNDGTKYSINDAPLALIRDCGLSDKMAQAIISARTQQVFVSIGDCISRIPGLGRAKLLKLETRNISLPRQLPGRKPGKMKKKRNRGQGKASEVSEDVADQDKRTKESDRNEGTDSMDIAEDELVAAADVEEEDSSDQREVKRLDEGGRVTGLHKSAQQTLSKVQLIANLPRSLSWNQFQREAVTVGYLNSNAELAEAWQYYKKMNAVSSIGGASQRKRERGPSSPVDAPPPKHVRTMPVPTTAPRPTAKRPRTLRSAQVQLQFPDERLAGTSAGGRRGRLRKPVVRMGMVDITQPGISLVKAHRCSAILPTPGATI
jgi:DNA uptake protein ComE-like DNA-binding protein